MGIRDLFSSKPKQFVSRDSFESNLAHQIAMTPQTLEQLRKYNVTAEQSLKLEFFFYTNSESKAFALADALAKCNTRSDMAYRRPTRSCKSSLVGRRRCKCETRSLLAGARRCANWVLSTTASLMAGAQAQRDDHQVP